MYLYTQSYIIVLVCGRIFTPTQALISNGATAQYGTAPWNIGVYRMNYNDKIQYDMICGGTLISANLAISGKNLIHILYLIKIQNDYF